MRPQLIVFLFIFLAACGKTSSGQTSDYDPLAAAPIIKCGDSFQIIKSFASIQRD